MANGLAHVRVDPNSSFGVDLLEEQRRQNDPSKYSSLPANLTLSCDDGSIPVHPALFINASPLMRMLLSRQNPSEPSFIHLAGYSLSTLNRMVELVYSGRTMSGPQTEQRKLFFLLKQVGFPVSRIQFQPLGQSQRQGGGASVTNGGGDGGALEKVGLRCIRHVRQGLDMDDEITLDQLLTSSKSFLQDGERVNKMEDDKENKKGVQRMGMQPPKPKRDNLYQQQTQRSKYNANNRNVNMGEETVAEGILPSTSTPTVHPRPRPPPPQTSSSQLKMVTNSWTESTECFSCMVDFPSEIELIQHLNVDCANILRDYYDYDRKCCLVCERCDFRDIWELLLHAQVCDDWNSSSSGLREEDKEAKKNNPVDMHVAVATTSLRFKSRRRKRPWNLPRLTKRRKFNLSKIRRKAHIRAISETEDDEDEDKDEIVPQKETETCTADDVVPPVPVTTTTPTVSSIPSTVFSSEARKFNLSKIRRKAHIRAISETEDDEDEDKDEIVPQKETETCTTDDVVPPIPATTTTPTVSSIPSTVFSSEARKFNLSKIRRKAHIPAKPENDDDEDEDKDEIAPEKETETCATDDVVPPVPVTDDVVPPVPVTTTTPTVSSIPSTVFSSEAESAGFPSHIGDWKFLKLRQFDDVVYGIYVNSANKTMGLSASQAKDWKL